MSVLPVEGGTGRKQGVSLQRCSGCAAALHLIHYCNFLLKSRRDQQRGGIQSFGQLKFTGRYSVYQTAGGVRIKTILPRTQLAAERIIIHVICCAAVTDEKQRGENVIIQWPQHGGEKKCVSVTHSGRFVPLLRDCRNQNMSIPNGSIDTSDSTLGNTQASERRANRHPSANR